MKITNEYKKLVEESQYSEVLTVAMDDRGAYAVETEEEEQSDFSELGLLISREETPFTKADFANLLKDEKVSYFLDCLTLSTTEIKLFLQTLKEKDLLKMSKVFLLEMPQLEYLTLKSAGYFSK